MQKKKAKWGYFAYAGLLALLFALLIMNAFQLYPIKVDKFAYFVISLIFLLLLLPIVRYIKFFGLIEVRKDIAELKMEVDRLSARTRLITRNSE